VAFKAGSSSNFVYKSSDSGGLGYSNSINHSLEMRPAGYVAHLCMDKPLYQPGEEVFFRAIALEQAPFRAPHEQLDMRFILEDPNQKVLFSRGGKATLRLGRDAADVLKDRNGRTVEGVASWSYQLPRDPLGGEYTLKVEEVGGVLRRNS